MYRCWMASAEGVGQLGGGIEDSHSGSVRSLPHTIKRITKSFQLFGYSDPNSFWDNWEFQFYLQRAMRAPTSEPLQPGWGDWGGNSFFHSSRSWRWGRCCDTPTPQVAMTGTCSNSLQRTSPPRPPPTQPGVLTGAIHHGGTAPPTIQG